MSENPPGLSRRPERTAGIARLFWLALYGASLAGIVVLMSWLWICSIVLLVAAELNKVIEDASPLGKPYGQKHEDRP